jgi:hypothetical protein
MMNLVSLFVSMQSIEIKNEFKNNILFILTFPGVSLICSFGMLRRRERSISFSCNKRFSSLSFSRIAFNNESGVSSINVCFSIILT